MYLCYQLMDLLKSSTPSRIIIVASEQHRMCSQKLTVDDLLFMKKEHYSRWTAYNRSKLLNVIFMKGLSERLRGSGVTVHATHPGAPIDTSLMRDNVLGSKLMDYLILRPICFFFCRNAAEGAQTPLYPALVPEYGQKSGCYFENCRATTMNPILNNDQLVRDVWNRSCDLLRIDRNWV
uniref:Uncharacterized protein n=1 Tax=Romanomermis culicivorax TaxID=13658 RepID=A0A915IGJ5_ROMCU